MYGLIKIHMYINFLLTYLKVDNKNKLIFLLLSYIMNVYCVRLKVSLYIYIYIYNWMEDGTNTSFFFFFENKMVEILKKRIK